MKIFRGAAEIKDVTIDGKTVLNQKLFSENVVKASFTLDHHFNFQLGDFITHKGRVYAINRQPQVKKRTSREYEYNIIFYGPEYALENAMYLLDGIADFFLQGNIETFIDLLVANLNRVAGSTVYSIGSVPPTNYKNLSFDRENCLSVLNKVCQEFDLEYKFDSTGKVITVAQSVGNDTSLTLEYKAGLRHIERREVGERTLITRLYPYGATRNITSDYGFRRLRLAAAPYYLEQNVGVFGVVEGVVNFDDIYPRRTGTITSTASQTTFVDSAMNFNLNDYLTSSVAKVTFNTGQLAGYEFEIEGYNNATKQFTIISITDAQDLVLPNATLKPAIGDEYVLHDISLPQSYIDTAEAELLARATAYLAENSLPNVTYDITPDPVYFGTNLISLEAGDLITIDDDDFGISIQTQIIELTQSLADPYDYSIKTGNKVVINYINRVLNGVLQNSSVITREVKDRTTENLRIRNTYNDLTSLPDLIFDEEGYFDPTKIKPLSIETQYLAVGAKPLQLNFIGLEIETNYLANANALRISASTLVHFSIEAAPREWTVPASSPFIGDNNFRYLYVQAVSTAGSTSAAWLLSSSKLSVTSTPGKYTFLVGVIHAVASGARGFSQLYGQTFINGKFITTGRVRSLSGQSYIDLDNDKFNIGPGANGIDWDVTNAGKLTIRGALVQSAGGTTFPAIVYRGNYSSIVQYYQGDSVTYNGETYVFINTISAIGQPPTNPTYWQLYAAAGADGIDGIVGEDAFGAIPDVQSAMVGGVGDFIFTLDMRSGGVVNPGEIRIQASKFTKPDGAIRTNMGADDEILTSFGEGNEGRFFIVWTDTLLHSRYGASATYTNTHYMPIFWNGSSYGLVTNSGVIGTVVLQATDVFLCVVEAKTTSSGLTGYVGFVQGAAGLDGDTGPAGPAGPAGAPGDDGNDGPGILFRGVFAAGVYYNNVNRRDVVKQGASYYIFNGVNGSNQASFIAGNWESFGASFDSVATGLLLAELATIADWVIKTGRIASQQEFGGTPKAQLRGDIGALWLTNGVTVHSGTGSAQANVPFFAYYDAQYGGIRMTRDAANGQPAALLRIRPDGIYIDTARPLGSGDVYDGRRRGINAPVSARQRKVAGFEYIAAVYGSAVNTESTNPAEAYGGYFEGIYMTGPVVKACRRVTGTVTLAQQSTDYILICTGGTVVVMPPNPVVGRAFIVKRTTSSVTINGNGINIWHNADEGLTLGIVTNGMAFKIVYDGVYWQVMILEG